MCLWSNPTTPNTHRVSPRCSALLPHFFVAPLETHLLESNKSGSGTINRWIHSYHDWLVVSTHLKHISPIGNLPQIGTKIQNIWNHHYRWVSLLPYASLQFPLEKSHLITVISARPSVVSTKGGTICPIGSGGLAWPNGSKPCDLRQSFWKIPDMEPNWFFLYIVYVCIRICNMIFICNHQFT